MVTCSCLASSGQPRPARSARRLCLTTLLLFAAAAVLVSPAAGRPPEKRKAPAAAAVPTLALSPTSGQVGSSVTATGAGYPRKSTGTITFDGLQVGTYSVPSSGKWSSGFTVPAHAPGSAVVTAGPASGVFTVTKTPDTTRPTAPGNLTATTGDGSVALHWDASTDNVAVTGYRVLRGGGLVATVGASTTTYTESGLINGSTYSYTVEAFDAAGNISPDSNVASVTPQAAADTTAPSVPSGLAAAAGNQQVALSWNASTDPDDSVALYRVYRDGTLIASPTATSYTDGGLTNGTMYGYAVSAVDSHGNESAKSVTVSAMPTAPPTGNDTCGQQLGTAPPSTWSHVVWIVMENRDYSQIIGNSAAPYENLLASNCGLATNFTAETHPSLPNYIAMTSGSTQGVTDNGNPSSHPLAVPSIFSQEPGGASRSLEESMPFNCYTSDSGTYRIHHNPMPYYINLGTDCANYDVPLGAIPDVSAAFTFVTPNNCNNMHDCSISTGDSWLAAFIPKIVSTSDYQAGRTAIFLTFDENDGTAGNHVMTEVLSAHTTPGARSSAAYNHYNMLATTEDMLGVARLGNAVGAASMAQPFGLQG
jgi:chitodextrinase